MGVIILAVSASLFHYVNKSDYFGNVRIAPCLQSFIQLREGCVPSCKLCKEICGSHVEISTEEGSPLTLVMPRIYESHLSKYVPI